MTGDAGTGGEQIEALRREILAARSLGPAHARAVAALSAQGDRVEAAALLRSSAKLQASNPADIEALGFVAFGLGAHEVARDCYRKFTALAPGDALGWYNLATALRNTGALAEAEEACDRALTLSPSLAQAALLRAHVRTQTPGHNHVDALRAGLQRAPAAGAIFFHYALGKELEDLGAYDEAFDHYAMGAAIRRQSLRYDVRDDVAKLARIKASFPADAIAKAPPLAGAEHGFIFGLPRSGTTMVERVLTGHPGVGSNGETDLLLGALMAGTPAEGGDIFSRVAAADPSRVAAAYRRLAGPLAGQSLVLEKLPMNYLYAGAIRLTLPSARMIIVRRSALDNIFAMYATLFGSGYPFSYDFADLAAYHEAYCQLVAHWQALLGDQLLVIDYEAFVEEPRLHGARAAAHLGLNWNDAMTAIEQNRSATATASAAQVRRPIYTSAVGRAARFGRHLEPLADRLQAMAEKAS